MYAVIDVGTTSIKLKLYSRDLSAVAIESYPIGCRATCDPRLIRMIFENFLRRASNMGAKLAGISTFRASILAWSKDGEPLSEVITWLDERSSSVISRPLYRILSIISPLRKILKPESPAVKIRWLLESREDLRRKVEKGEAYIGTLSSYLAYLVARRYINDATNEALTGLVNPRNLRRINAVYEILRIPHTVDPEIIDNNTYIGTYAGVDIVALIGDQQAACIGSSCLGRGCLKVTSGTGIFLDAPLEEYTLPPGRLIPIVLYSMGGEIRYGVEGFNPSGGVVIDWLIRSGILRGYEELDEAASRAKSSVVVVPSLMGLNFPAKRGYGSMSIHGLTPETSREDIIRSVLEAIALAACSIADRLRDIVGGLSFIRADGGLSRSSLYLKLLAEACNLKVERVKGFDATGRGVALLEALYEGWLKLKDLDRLADIDLVVEPGLVEIRSYRSFWRRGEGHL